VVDREGGTDKKGKKRETLAFETKEGVDHHSVMFGAGVSSNLGSNENFFLTRSCGKGGTAT
jgi:hypothetical protein